MKEGQIWDEKRQEETYNQMRRAYKEKQMKRSETQPGRRVELIRRDKRRRKNMRRYRDAGEEK